MCQYNCNVRVSQRSDGWRAPGTAALILPGVTWSSKYTATALKNLVNAVSHCVCFDSPSNTASSPCVHMLQIELRDLTAHFYCPH